MDRILHSKLNFILWYIDVFSGEVQKTFSGVEQQNGVAALT